MEEETMMQCPFNSSHWVLKHRMSSHLIKCRLQHPGKIFSTCPFNSTHLIPVPEFQSHIGNCPDQRYLDSGLHAEGDTKTTSVDSFHIELPPSNENWDEESRECGSYLDEKNKLMENLPVFRIPVGLSKAQRKEFYSKEVNKFQLLSNGISKDRPNKAATRSGAK